MPVDNLVSNWAYMVMASLAWTLKAWFGLSLGEKGRWRQNYKSQKQAVLKMEFKKFRNNFIQLPCRIIRTGRNLPAAAGGDCVSHTVVESLAGSIFPGISGIAIFTRLMRPGELRSRYGRRDSCRPSGARKARL